MNCELRGINASFGQSLRFWLAGCWVLGICADYTLGMRAIDVTSQTWSDPELQSLCDELKDFMDKQVPKIRARAHAYCDELDEEMKTLRATIDNGEPTGVPRSSFARQEIYRIKAEQTAIRENLLP